MPMEIFPSHKPTEALPLSYLPRINENMLTCLLVDDRNEQLYSIELLAAHLVKQGMMLLSLDIVVY